MYGLRGRNGRMYGFRGLGAFPSSLPVNPMNLWSNTQCLIATPGGEVVDSNCVTQHAQDTSNYVAAVVAYNQGRYYALCAANPSLWLYPEQVLAGHQPDAASCLAVANSKANDPTYQNPNLFSLDPTNPVPIVQQPQPTPVSAPVAVPSPAAPSASVPASSAASSAPTSAPLSSGVLMADGTVQSAPVNGFSLSSIPWWGWLGAAGVAVFAFSGGGRGR